MSSENGVWRTISGRRVFIREGQSLSDAMRESGKFSGKDSDKQERDTISFGKSELKKALGLTKEIVDDREYLTYGFRAQSEDTETIGKTMTHTSKNFGGDFEGTAQEGERLPGVSTIGADRTHQVGEYGGYEGSVLYLVGSNTAEPGYDPGEMILNEPTVLAKLGVKNGELTVLEKIDIERKKPETPKVQPPKSIYAGTKEQVNEYVSFKFSMENKYGVDTMWRNMTDAEIDRLERLERIAHRGR